MTEKAHGIWLPRKGASSRHPICMAGGGQAICPHRNFAGGMKNLIIKDIKKKPQMNWISNSEFSSLSAHTCSRTWKQQSEGWCFHREFCAKWEFSPACTIP